MMAGGPSTGWTGIGAGGCCCCGSASPPRCVFDRWGAIRGFALGDTDDNMRMMQVRGLLDGQGWYDLRQHRLSPPAGATSTGRGWSTCRSPGSSCCLRPLFGGRVAEPSRWRSAPLLPMLVGDGGAGGDARRLVDGSAFCSRSL